MSDNNKHTYSWRKYLEQLEEDDDKLPDIIRLLEQQDNEEHATSAYDDFIESLLGEQGKKPGLGLGTRPQRTTLRPTRRPTGKTSRKKPDDGTTTTQGSSSKQSADLDGKGPRGTFKRKQKVTVTKRQTSRDKLGKGSKEKPLPQSVLKQRTAAAARIAKNSALFVGLGAVAACVKGGLEAPSSEEDPMLGPLKGAVDFGGGCLDALKGVYEEVFGNPQTAVEKEMAKLIINCFQKLQKFIYDKKEFQGEDRLKKLKNYKVTAADLAKVGCSDCDGNLEIVADGDKKTYDCVKDMQKMWDKVHKQISKDGKVKAANFIAGLAPYIAYDIAKTNMSSGLNMAGGFLLDLITKFVGPAAASMIGAMLGGAATLFGARKAKGNKGVASDMVKNSRTPAGRKQLKQINQKQKNPTIKRPPRLKEERSPLLEILGLGGGSAPVFAAGNDQMTVSAEQVIGQMKSLPADNKVSTMLYGIYLVQLFMEDPFDFSPMDMELFIQQADSELTKFGDPLDIDDFLGGVTMSGSGRGGSLSYGGKKYSAEEIVGDLGGEVVELEQYGIQHNLEGERKIAAERFAKALYDYGFTNKYFLAGALAVMGKESGFKGKSEGVGYGIGKLSSFGSGIPSRTRSIFQKYHGRDPLPSELAQLAYTGPRVNGVHPGVALFNIGYGYHKYQRVVDRKTRKVLVEPIDMPPLVKGPDDPKPDGGLTINPKLFNPRLPGFLYRGRGPIQNTFASNYYGTSKSAGLDAKKMLEDPGLLARSPLIGAIMSAKFTDNVFKNSKKVNIMQNQFDFDIREPTSIEEGIFVLAAVAMGGGKRNLFQQGWYQRAVRNAKRAAAKRIRVIEDEPQAIVENKDVD